MKIKELFICIYFYNFYLFLLFLFYGDILYFSDLLGECLFYRPTHISIYTEYMHPICAPILLPIQS